MTTAKGLFLVILLAAVAGAAEAEVAVGNGVGTISDGGAGTFPDYGPPLVIVTSATRAISPSFDDWQLSNCGQIGDVAYLIDEVRNAVTGTYVLWSTLGLEF